LTTLVAAGIRHIELSNGEPVTAESERWFREQKEKHKLNFLIHNYFLPDDDFVLNLASQNAWILNKSITHYKKAIELARDLQSPIYSIHAGFRTDPAPAELGMALGKNNITPYETAYLTMVESLKQLCDFAGKFGITMAVENHELSGHNLVGGKNELLLMVEADEFSRVLADVRRDNLKVLLDLGHLNVSSTTLNFDKLEFIDKIKHKLALFHVSHNDGKRDEHNMITPESWFWPVLKKYRHIDCVVESHNLDLAAIRQISELFQ